MGNEQIGTKEKKFDAKSRAIAIVVLVLVLLTIWFMLDIAIVTFVMTFVFYHLQKYALKGLAKTPFRVIPAGLVLLIIYVVVIFLFVLFAAQNTPDIMRQLGNVAVSLGEFDFYKFITDVDPGLAWLGEQIDLNEYIVRGVEAIVTGVANLSSAALNFLMALILSFLFVLEKKKIGMIGDSIKDSRIAYIYRYIMLFAGSFCYTFGKVMKVQVVIAAINCAISTVSLSILGGFEKYIMVLSLMIFILGLIPVAGVFISLVPLCIIAFNVGGLMKVIVVLIMIAVIHCIEAYFLNPKLMSRRTSLPVSLVFVVLIISQRYLGAWGMLIGVPLFIYILNVLNIDYRRAMEAELEELLWKTQQKEEKTENGNKGKFFGFFKKKQG